MEFELREVSGNPFETPKVADAPAAPVDDGAFELRPVEGNPFAGEPEPDTSLSFGQSVGRGVKRVQAMGGGFVEASGEATGLDTLRDWGREVRTRNMAEAGQTPRSISFEGIRSMGDFGTWAKETIGEQLPMMAPSLAGGVAGGAIGAATPVPGGMVLGAALGAFAPSLVLGTGEVQMNIKEKSPETESPGAAFVGGTAIAALDTILPGKIGSSLVRKLGREAAETVAQRALMKRVAVEGGKGLATEGLTEAIQEAVAEVSAAVGTDQDPDWEGLRTQMIEAGAAGALMGGGASAITAMVPDRKAPLGPTDQPEQTEQPAMPVQEPDPRGAPPAPEAGPVEAALQGSPAPEAPPPGVQGEQTAPDQTGVPFMITAAMREELDALGYGPEQIRAMRPEEANSIIGGGMKAEPVQVDIQSIAHAVAETAVNQGLADRTAPDGLSQVVHGISDERGINDINNRIAIYDAARAILDDATGSPDGRSDLTDWMSAAHRARDLATPKTLRNPEVIADFQQGFEDVVNQTDTHLDTPAYQNGRRKAKAWINDNPRPAQEYDLIPVDDAVAEAAELEPIKTVRPRKPRKTGPQSLLEWIADRGGITDPGGDLRAMGADRWHRQAPFRRKLVKDVPQGQGGMFGQADVNSPDYVREAAIEAGYLPEDADVNALLGAIDAELRGQDQVRPEDQEVREARARDDAIKDDRMRRGQMIRDIRALGRELGETFHKQEVDAVVSLMETDPSLDAATAVEFHIERLAIQAAETYRSKTDDDAYDIPFESTRGETEPQRLETGDDQGVDGQAPEPEGPDAGQTPGPDSGQDGNAQGVIPPTETLDTADGKKEQTVIPGAERDQRGANQRRADAPLKASEEQKGVDGLGLFDEGSRDTTGDMFVEASKPAQPNPKTEPVRQPADKIDDFGEKIGGARKDMAIKTGERKGPVDNRPAWQKRYAVVQIAAETAQGRNTGNAGKWSITDTRTGRPLVRKYFDTQEDAEDALPLAVVSKKHRVVSDGDTFKIIRDVTDRKRATIKDGFEARDDAMRYIAENAVEIIETKTRIDASINPALEKAIRKGDARREVDRDVKPKDFTDIFGFRGVEFGNWNNQAERQHIMNQAYDAFLDMAELIGVDPKAISLNGELALAFGARGSGLSGAAAHYERNYGVINLTKIKGAGSLAHEWMHAFDHYLGRQAGKASSEKTADKHGNMVFKAGKPDSDYVSHGFGYRAKERTRAELKDAFDAVMDAITHRKMEFTEDASVRERIEERTSADLDRKLDTFRNELTRELTWGTKKYQKPATAAQMKQVDKLLDRIRKGEYGEETYVAPAGKGRMSQGYSFPKTLVDLSKLHKEIRGRQGYGRQQGRQHGPIVDLNHAIKAKVTADQFLGEAKEQKVKTKKVRSDYYSQAWRIDQGGTKDYWSTPHELAARAFGAYIYDRLKGIDARNDFLSYEQHNDIAVYKLLGVKPFPEGAERTAINNAFDNLFDVIETRETDRGVEMYQAREGGTNEGIESDFNEEMALNHPGVTGVQFPRWGAVKRLNNNVLSHADFVKEREKSPDKYRAGTGDRAPRLSRNMGDLESSLRERLAELGVSDPSKISVRVRREIEAWVEGKKASPYGLYQNRLIKVLLDAPSPLTTLDHEAIHAFRDLGLINPMEWKVLTNNVRVDKDLMARIDGIPEYRNLSEDERLEEAVAFKFQDRDLRGRWKAIKDRISAVIEAIGNWLRGNGFQSAEDVFRAIERGEVGSRQETRAPGEGPMLAAAYHGSPHDFDTFTTDKIGTGEGAQAFGWGLYFAGKKEVAEHYRQGLSYKQIRDDFRDALPDDADFEEVMDLVGTGHFSQYQERVLRALDADDWLGFDYPSQAISAALGKNLDNWDPSQELRDAVKNIGRLYEVNLVPQEDEYLLWDKPLSEQSEKVKAALNLRIEEDKYSDLWPPSRRKFDVVVDNLSGNERAVEGFSSRQEAEDWLSKTDGGTFYSMLGTKLPRQHLSQELAMAGIPGIKYLDGSSRSDGDGTYNYVIFDESLVEVKAKYQMREAAAPEYTLPAEENTGPHEATISRIMGTTDKPLSQKIRESIEAFKENGLLRMKQGFLDQFAVIEDYERARFGDLAEANLSPFKATHMTQNLQSVMGAVLRFGPLKVEDGWFKLDEDFGKGFEQIFEPLAESGKLRLWKGWAIANRAKRLMDEGREHLLTEAEINELLPLGDQHPEFQQVLDEWTAFNQKMLDMAEAAGLINADQRALWEKSDYVPFYRVIEDAESVKAAKSGRKGLEGQRSGIKALRGGESKVNDPLENMVLSMTSLVDRSFKNLAMQKVTALLEDAGAMEQAPKDFVPAYIPASEVEKRLTEEGILDRALSKEERDQVIQMFQITAPRDPDVVSVMVGGKPVWYKVHDPLVLKAVSAMTPEQVGGVMKIFRMAKRTLTQGITADPAFMLANFLRDVGSAFVTAPIKGMRPGIDAIKGFKKALMGDTSLARLMAAGGGSGGFYRTDPSDVRKQMDARHRGIDQTRIIDTPKKAWEFWRRVGQASEAANRIAIMEAVRKNGGSDAEAAYQALDLMDFSMRGDFAAVRWLIETVPFMNARIQGLYRLYRGARDNPKAFMLRGAIITAASMALLAANWDDERYQDLEDWDKDTYYHFWIGDDHYSLPKPFEVGAIFSTIPERMMRLMAGQDDGEKAAQRTLAMMADTFAMNPIPQLVKPVAELWANKSFFTDRDIVGMGLDRLDPEAQWTPWTSLTARWLGEVLPDALGDAKSPKRIDHLVRGYFGALGMYVLGVSDSALRLVGDYPDAPDKRREDIPVLGRFLRDTPARSTVHVTDFYDMQKEAGRLLSTIREYERRGMTDEARELFKEHRGEIRTAKGLNKVASVLSNINRQIRAVNHHPTLSPAEKRRLIDALTEEKNRVVKMAANRARATMSIIEDLENKPQAGRKLNPLLN